MHSHRSRCIAITLGTASGSSDDVAVAGGLALAVPGSNDIASIMRSGTTAFAGSDPVGTGDFDLAAVFGDMPHAVATGSNGLVDILP